MILAGCRIPVEYSVLLMGDSLMANSLTDTTRGLLMSDDVGALPVVSAISGTAMSHVDYGAEYWLARAPEILRRHPVDAVVISLGINDAGLNELPDKRVPPDVMEAYADRLMQAYGGRTVFWILPHARGAQPDAGATAVADAIRRAATRHPEVRLLDFATYLQGRGQRLADVLQADGVHLTASGNDLWAQMVLQEVVADARRRGLAPVG